jgi:tetratricopeptide (TPR) repeat protein
MKYSIRLCALLLALSFYYVSSGAAYAQKSKKKSKAPMESELREAEDTFTEGMKYHMLESYDRALPLFERALQLSPDNSAIYFQIADTRARRGEYAQATAAAEKAAMLDEQNHHYQLLLAQLYEKQSKFAEAVKIYQKLIKKNPQNDEYYFPLAATYLYMGKYDEAIKVYEKIEKIYGVNEEISRQKQQIYLRQNKLPEAIREGKILIREFPDEPMHVEALAEMLIANNKHEEAGVLVEGLLQKKPDSPRARLILADIYRSQGKTDLYREQLSMAFSNPELDIDAKIKILVGYLNLVSKPEEKETALKLAELTVNAHPDDAKAYAMYGDLLSLTGNRQDARKNYLASTRMDGSKFMVWQQIVAIDMELQQFDSLAKHSEEAIELFPNQPFFWLYNGVAHTLNKNPKKAIGALEQGKKLAFNDKKTLLEFHSQLGDAYNELKDYKKSEAAYEEALSLDPNYAPVLNNYSYYLSLRKVKLDKARKMGEKLIMENPDNATYLDTFGWVLYANKEYAEAKKYLEKAALHSPSGTIIEHYGDVLYQLGEVEKAHEQWKKAKEVGGELTELIDKKIATKRIHE